MLKQHLENRFESLENSFHHRVLIKQERRSFFSPGFSTTPSFPDSSFFSMQRERVSLNNAELDHMNYNELNQRLKGDMKFFAKISDSKCFDIAYQIRGKSICKQRRMASL